VIFIVFGFSKPDVQKMTAKRDVKGLIKALSYTKSYDIPDSAANALVKIGDQAVEPLINELHHPNLEVRWRAAEALGKIGDPRAVEGLTKALNDQIDIVSLHAAEALGKIGDPRAVEALIEALDNPSVAVSSPSAIALGKIGDPRAFEALAKALRDTDVRLRASAADALGMIGGPTAIEALTEALNDSSEGIRLKAELNLRLAARNLVQEDAENQRTNMQKEANYSLVREVGSGSVVGFWLKDLEYWLEDYPPSTGKISYVRLKFLLAEHGVPPDAYHTINSGDFRTVPNTFDNKGGYFLMFGSNLAPGERKGRGRGKA
jgi:hypothetical protein